MPINNIDLLFAQQGFFSVGMLNRENALAAAILREEDWPEESIILVALFPFLTEDDNPSLGKGNIAPFARANYYREMVKRIGLLIRNAPAPLSTLPKSRYRIFCNSRLPEKELALQAGLGFIGRNTLLTSASRGSSCLIGGIILPPEITITPPVPPLVPPEGCGECRICRDFCPGGAIREEGFDRDKCLQNWTTDDRPVPEELKRVWGNRIYGCTECQEICPWSIKAPEGIKISRGTLPGEVPLEFFLSSPREEIRDYLKGTALGMKWIRPDLLQRNAVLAAVSTGRKDLLKQIEQLLDPETPLSLMDSCHWALKQFNRDQG